MWDQDTGGNLVYCEDTSRATGLEEYKLYTRALKIMKNPWLQTLPVVMLTGAVRDSAEKGRLKGRLS